MRKAILTLTTLLLTSWAMAQNNIIKLPAPSKTGGMPLMEALSKRATNRTMDGEKSLSQQQLSDLLWAAWGINREDGRRTAPSALNRQEIDLYLIGRKGAYRYDAEAHALVPVAEGDLRGKVNSQEYTRTGDWILIFVVVHSTVNREEVAKTLGLKSSQHIALGQTVGIPARR